MNSRKATKFSPQFIRLDQPLKGRRKVLSEDSFKRLLLEEKLTMQEIEDRYGIAHQTLNCTLRYWAQKYGAELRAVQSAHYARAMKGNKRGEKAQPAVVLPKEELSRLLKKGFSLPNIARRLGTSEWFVKENVTFHGLVKNLQLPRYATDVDLAYLEKLEQFSPGITQAMQTYYADPHKFFRALYLAHLRVQELVWFIQEWAKTCNTYREHKKIPKDHISWKVNQYEMRLSMALLEQGIPHVREFAFYKNYLADFFFPGTKLMLELDGEYHRMDAATKVRDLKRSKIAKRLGYQTLRVPNSEVIKDLPSVVQKVIDSLPLRYGVSVSSA